MKSRMSTREQFEVRCNILSAILRDREPMTEEAAAARFSVSVREIGRLLDGVRERGWPALVHSRRGERRTDRRVSVRRERDHA
jgi:predicted DNA-binding transcriptional regulator YafY